MLMATQPLGPVLSPSHGGPSSFSSSVSLGGQWAPCRPAVSSKVSCTRIGLSEVDNGKVVGHIDVDEEEQTMQVQGITTVTATVAVRLKEGISTPEKVADMRHTEPQPAKYLRMDDVTGSFIYESSFGVRSSFGAIEVYISDIEVHLHGGHHHSSAVTFQCNSWIACNNPDDHRFFFPLKATYSLPYRHHRSIGCKLVTLIINLRKEELKAIRGNGRGERKEWERVYDYDVYNDLGDPDNDPATRRPVLGGRERPYPRRCRTGRHRCRADPSSESPPATADGIYVPRDEAFTERRAGAFATKRALSMLSAFTTARRVSGDRRRSFPSLAAIDALYEDGYKNRPPSSQPEADDVDGYLAGMVQRQVKLLLKGEEEEFKEELRKLFKFRTSEIHDKDKLAWLRDEEFARQTLAGMNPLSIQLEFPIFSKLDEETYGPGDSLITRELIEGQINGVMTAEELDDTTLYASRTLFFLTEDGTLRPIAIELTRPKSPNTPQWRQVFTPGSSVAASWLWQLAKTHPYVIAANRRLSQMHPIYRLLHPHFRFTMEINAQARGMLISANGIIESAFAPGKHCMELSSAVYDKFWRFDMEALPADLIRRGMAFHGEDGKLKLTIED
uniref:Lipoxygenase domain-containing protein n=1 Tax=Oryza nivara TaxID=4536 RepID=A0A0E0JB63_ORYNI